MDKTEQLLKLSEELSAPHVYDEFKRHTDALGGDTVRLGIIGQPNSAKTTLVNALLGTSLPVSNLTSNVCHTVITASASSPLSDGITPVVSDSPWLKQHKMSVTEIDNDISADTATPMELIGMISRCDLCVYLLNAQAALSRHDLMLLESLYDVDIPAVVVLSRLDLLQPADRGDVLAYVKSNLRDYHNVTVADIDGSVSQSASRIRECVDRAVTQADIPLTRRNVENFYLTVAIGRLYEICQGHIDECARKAEAIDAATEAKARKLDQQSNGWLNVETELRRRILATTDKVRAFLNEGRDDMSRRLSHDVDVCGDIKLFWEKDFPFRLEEHVRAEAASATQLVNQELIKILQWLQDELLRRFRCKMSVTTGIVGVNGKGGINTSSDVSVADTQRLKIVTRVGTAATVIAAGALFATTGIGGIIMAVSMVSGIGAEFFMRKQSNESKEEIKRHLPSIVERANMQLITDYEAKIEEVARELTTHLQTLRADWLETSRGSIEQEKAFALFNAGSDKWERLMARVNALGDSLLK